MSSPAPEAEQIPYFDARSHVGFTPFLRLALIRFLRPDRFAAAARHFISQCLEPALRPPVSMNIHEAFARSDPQTPVLILTCKHVHSATIIQDVARTKVIKCQSISLGNTGQRDLAEKMMLSGPGLGIWLVLENGHMDLQYLSGIPSVMDKADTSDEHFRLFITAEFVPKFPTNLLEISLRQYAEPALGLKANVIASLSWIEQDTLEAVASSEWMTLVYAMSFLHCWTLARQKFSHKGWCRQYEFHRNDLLHCLTFMRSVIEMNEQKNHGMSRPEIPWHIVQKMYAEVVLGSSVEHEHDHSVLNTQIRRYVSSRVYSSDFTYGVDFPGPFGQDLQSVIKTLATHPVTESAEVFGLDLSVGIEAEFSHSNDLKACLLIALSAPEASDEIDGALPGGQEESILEIATQILDQLPSHVKAEGSGADARALGIMGQGNGAMNLFRASEGRQLCHLLEFVRADLSDLVVYLKGGLRMGNTRWALAASILRAGTPPRWMALSFHISSLPRWLEQVRGAKGQIEGMGTDLTGCIAIGQCFSPAALTRYYMSQICSTYNWHSDSVRVTLKISNSDPDGDIPKDDLQISGLWLHGAGWDARASKLVAKTNPLHKFVALPPARLVVEQQPTEVEALMAYMAPLYTNSRDRSGAAIIHVQLMTVIDALFCPLAL